MRLTNLTGYEPLDWNADLLRAGSFVFWKREYAPPKEQESIWQPLKNTVAEL